MNILHPTSQRSKRAIDIAARVILVIADLAIIVFLYAYLGLGGSIIVYTAWVFAAFTLVGVILSIRKSRLSTFFLFVPIVIFGVYAVLFFYNVVLKY